MSQTTGKSGVDWSEAQKGLHTTSIVFSTRNNIWVSGNTTVDTGSKSSNTDSGFKDAISKEEDLGMTEGNVKQVRSIEGPWGWNVSKIEK